MFLKFYNAQHRRNAYIETSNPFVTLSSYKYIMQSLCAEVGCGCKTTSFTNRGLCTLEIMGDLVCIIEHVGTDDLIPTHSGDEPPTISPDVPLIPPLRLPPDL